MSELNEYTKAVQKYGYTIKELKKSTQLLLEAYLALPDKVKQSIEPPTFPVFETLEDGSKIQVG